MKRKFLRSLVVYLSVASSLFFGGYEPIASAHTLKMTQEGNISMSYDVAGVKMPDNTEKEAMKIAKSVTENFFKAVYEKQYRLAYNYFSPEIQSKMGYEAFANGLAKASYTSLLYCGVANYEGNLVLIDGRYEQVLRTDDGKIDPRLYNFRFGVNKIGNDWKIVYLVEEDVTLKYL